VCFDRDLATGSGEAEHHPAGGARLTKTSSSTRSTIPGRLERPWGRPSDVQQQGAEIFGLDYAYSNPTRKLKAASSSFAATSRTPATRRT
jgi:hypothetical protein